MRSTLSAQQASRHFKGKLVILIFPKHKYYKNIIHLIGLTKCSFSGAHQQRSYKTRYKVSRCGCKYLKILCKRSVEDSLQATALRTAKKPPHKASCSSFKPQYDWEASLKCGNSYSWIHNTEQTSYFAENQCPFHASPNFNHATQCSMFAQLFLEERKVLYTLSEQFIPLVVLLQKPDQLNQLLWLKTAHPACQEACRIFIPVLFTNSKTELFSDSRTSHLFFPPSQFSTILIAATLGKTCTCFPSQKHISPSPSSLFLF